MIVQNSIPPHAKKVTEQKLSLFNILTCLLCSAKAKVAHICPNCSKFYCEGCIKLWIEEGNQYCPNCKGHINLTNVVNCNKLSQDLSNALQALIQLEAPQEFQCTSHSIPQTYYCLDCKKAICSDCIVLETSHKGHNITKLKKIKIEFNEQILLLLSKVRKSIKQIEKTKQERSLQKNNQSEEMKAKVEKLKHHMQRVKITYEQIINETNQYFENLFQKNKLIQISQAKMYEQFLQEVKQMPKTCFVRRKQTQLQQILQRSMQQITHEYVTKEDIMKKVNNGHIGNIISCRFSQKTFILYNYTQYRSKGEVIYSDSFFEGPLEWRLKIYPNGLEEKRQAHRHKLVSSASFGQEYISIYIELVSGVREAARYKFNIQIANQNDESKVISQVYEADFDAGKCWGYDEFANISTLYQKGYVHPDQDSLKISVSVGPPSYYYATLDQQAIISQKQQKLIANQLRINSLKRILGNPHNKDDLQVKLTNQFQKQNLNQPSIPSALNQSSSLEDVTTPRCRVQKTSEQKIHEHTQDQQVDDRQLNFEDYVVEEPIEQISRCNEEFDHQSAELRKIYRRLANMNQRGSLLLF